MIVQHRLRLHVLIVGTIIIIAGLIAASDTLYGKAEALIVWTEGIIELQPLLGMVVFVVLAMVSAMVAFFSSAVLVPVAIVAWGHATAAVLLWLGWLLGGIASFCIARFLGRRVAAVFIGEQKIAGWEKQFAARLRFPDVLMFQAVVPSEIPGYLLGLLGYRFLYFLAALAITELPYVIGVVFLGDYFLEGKAITIILLGLGVVVIGLIALRLRRRFLHDNLHQ